MPSRQVGVRVTALMEQIDQQLNESALLNPEPAEEAPTSAGLTSPAPAPPVAVPAKESDDEDEDSASGSDRPLRRRNR